MIDWYGSKLTLFEKVMKEQQLQTDDGGQENRHRDKAPFRTGARYAAHIDPQQTGNKA